MGRGSFVKRRRLILGRNLETPNSMTIFAGRLAKTTSKHRGPRLLRFANSTVDVWIKIIINKNNPHNKMSFPVHRGRLRLWLTAVPGEGVTFHSERRRFYMPPPTDTLYGRDGWW